MGAKEDFVQLGRWYGKESGKWPQGRFDLEVTIYTAFGEELGTGDIPAEECRQWGMPP